MAINKIFASRVNNIDATQFVGQINEEGQIWYDPSDGVLRLYNGEPGGIIINGGSGNATQLVNGTSNVVVYPDGNVAVSVNGTSNVIVFSNPNTFTGNLSASGNVSAENILADAYFYANGEPFSGGTNYSNANVAAYLPTNTSNVAANAITATGNITGNYFIGNGALLTGVVTDYGNANVAAFLADLGSNAVSTTANITADYFVGNGALLTGIAGTYSNANVEAYLPSYTGNLNPDHVSATGNITGNYLFGNGSQLTGITADYSNANVISLLSDLGANNISTAGNVAADYFVGNGSQLTGIVATEIGNLATLTVSGNVTAGNLQTVGNVSATYFLGNGAFLTGITGGNGVPSQAGQAGKFLTTDGTTASWNDALGASLTFNGGVSYADQATELLGGTASSLPDNAIDGGGAASDFSLTLSPVALTGQYEDLVDLDVSIPVSPSSAGAKGQIAFDTNFIYLCVAPNVWRRATLASWS